MSDFEILKDCINKTWAEIYPGAVDANDISALKCRIKNIAEDRNCWLFNAKVLNNKLNEIEKSKLIL